MLTHLFTPEQCALCKLCCNFHRSSAWETPVIDDKLATTLNESGVPMIYRKDGSRTFCLTFTSSDPSESANCPVLDTCKGCMLPREQRPFECRIWPLRLMREDDGTLILGLYLNCPALTPSVRNKIIQEATGALLPMLIEEAHRQPLIVRPVDPAYAVIWQDK